MCVTQTDLEKYHKVHGWPPLIFGTSHLLHFVRVLKVLQNKKWCYIQHTLVAFFYFKVRTFSCANKHFLTAYNSNFQPVCCKIFKIFNTWLFSQGHWPSVKLKNDNNQHNNSHLVWMNQNYAYFLNYILLIVLLKLSWCFPLCPPSPGTPYSLR